MVKKAPPMVLAPSELHHAAELWREGRMGEALSAVMKILSEDPSNPEPWELAGYFLISRKKWDEAAGLLSAAAGAFPQRPVLHARYALALAKIGKTTEAWRQANEALRLDPDMVDALLARIEILFDAGYYDLALTESLKLADKNIPGTAAFCEGAAAFLSGDLARGMPLLASVTRPGWRGKDMPEWDGETDKNKHVVIYNGQGFGDLIQFSRYIEAARPKVGSLTLLAPRSMEKLMRDSFPDLPFIAETDTIEVPAHITHRISLMSLAANGDFDPLPVPTPYLHADPALAAAWREKLAPIKGPRIGIVWMSPWQMNSPFRVVDFPTLKPLVDAAGGHLVSLQMGPEAKIAADAGIFDASPFIKDFADTAALMSELDLVISLDSAPAHLAGALGKPAWVFLPFSAEWRWLVQREDCIWYPGMRLYRQKQSGDWAEVFNAIALDIKKFMAGDSRVLKPEAWHGALPRRHPNPIPLPDLP